ncbi:hypothetical protein BV22DRAFT_1040953 [Leucogyrophana mollusca]|uniref:Uncharacterized protein n=1 Tax=Leucogyrophana mollusca TaxID=85980 RepID=A0ACB8B0P3_9AGAM|nr:hypothetical protein BV22DRAFT_1040953 [Leucogyrophana mollusca]
MHSDSISPCTTNTGLRPLPSPQPTLPAEYLPPSHVSSRLLPPLCTPRLVSSLIPLRIVNTELRQPKSEQGSCPSLPPLPSPPANSLPPPSPAPLLVPPLSLSLWRRAHARRPFHLQRHPFNGPLHGSPCHAHTQRLRRLRPPITTSAGISPFPMRIGVRVGRVEVA